MDRDPQRAGDVDGAQMSDVDTSQTNHLSFCAGYGGIDLGLRRVLPGCRTIAYVEIEAFAIANLVAKMEAGELDQAPVWTDVKTFPAEQFYGLVDIISGGYPCQPFSAAGKRLGTDDPRHLWPFLRGAVRAIRPSRVFFENVEGHISLGLSTVLSDLDEDGYEATWGIFSAAEVGASHQRKRVFILANSRCVSREVSVGWKQSAKPIIGSDGEARRTFPARPGQPQFDWEEPRVTGQVSQKLADFCAGDERARRDTTSSGGESVGEQRTSDNPSADGGSSVCGGDQEEARTVGHTDSASPVTETGDTSEVPEVPGEKRSERGAVVSGGTGEQCGEELADTKSGDTVINEEAGNRGERIGGGSEEELADSPGIRSKRFSEKAEQVGEASCRGRSDNGSEELGNPRSAEPCGLPDEARKDVSEVGDANRRQAESQLGRATDGCASRVDATTHRVDRLRLLGNGVVPATAAKAWIELSGRFE